MERQNCYICNKHKIITEMHKCVPTQFIKTKNEMFLNSIYYICPNCHTYIHKYINAIKRSDFKDIPEIIKYMGANRKHFVEVYTDMEMLKLKNSKLNTKELIEQFHLEKRLSKYYENKADEIMKEIIDENSNIIGIYENGKLTGLKAN